MKKYWNIGVIGMSEGNGHPYSWSAIFNGYNQNEMDRCPFPVIGQYLSEQQYPHDFLGDLGAVTGVWTQDQTMSEHIAEAAKIERIYTEIEELAENCDCILLARDDGERHLEMVAPILEAGKPVFVDKPFATTQGDASEMLRMQQYGHQIFTCTSLRYAEEFSVSQQEFHSLGKITEVKARCPKKWSTYGMHIVEPSFLMANDWSKVVEQRNSLTNRGQLVKVKKESGIEYSFEMTGDSKPAAIEITLLGTSGEITRTFTDSFNAFKHSLEQFIKQCNEERVLIPRHETIHAVSILEGGMM